MPNQYASYSRQVVDNVVDMLQCGSNPADVSRATGIPYDTIATWKRTRSVSVGLRESQRQAFANVLDTYTKLGESFGNTSAMDYGKTTGGSGARNSDNGIGHAVIEFQVDVVNAIKYALSDAEFKQFEKQVLYQLDRDSYMNTQTEAFMRIQERLGRVFIARQLYPVSEYFKITHGKQFAALQPTQIRRKGVQHP